MDFDRTDSRAYHKNCLQRQLLSFSMLIVVLTQLFVGTSRAEWLVELLALISFQCSVDENNRHVVCQYTAAAAACMCYHGDRCWTRVALLNL